jgi:RNA polymerase sigma-70 factor (ECF subfamily)
VPARRSNTDERKLELLFTHHADEVLTYLRHRTDHDTAQEVLTEVFVVAWRKLDRVPAEPRGWLYAVARRLLANHVRSRGRTAALMDRLIDECRIAPAEGDPQDTVARRHLLTLLAGLGEQDREVLLLAGWYELSGGEAAQVLGCSRTTYAVRLHRARRRLRAAMDDRAAPAEDAAPTMPTRQAWENR